MKVCKCHTSTPYGGTLSTMPTIKGKPDCKKCEGKGWIYPKKLYGFDNPLNLDEEFWLGKRPSPDGG